jgi:hypothetical protein
LTVTNGPVDCREPKLAHPNVPQGIIERDPNRPGRWLLRFTDGTTKAGGGKTRTASSSLLWLDLGAPKVMRRCFFQGSRRRA